MSFSERSTLWRSLTKTLLLALLFGAVNYALTMLYLRARQVNRGLNNKEYLVIQKNERQFAKYRNRIHFLFLGDSHTAVAVNPRLIGHAFNFSFFAEHFVHYYYRLRQLLSGPNRIQVVLLPIDIHSFSSFRRDNFPLDFYWVKHMNYWQVGWRKGQFPLFLLRWLAGNFFPYLGQYRHLMEYLGLTAPIPAKRNVVYRGFRPQYKFFQRNRKMQAKKRAEYQLRKRNYLYPLFVEYFQKTLALCHKHGKIVVLVKYPVSTTYFSYAARLLPVASFYQRLRSIYQHFPGIRLLDYQSYFFADEKKYFMDADHVNWLGANLLSRQIREDLHKIVAGQ